MTVFHDFSKTDWNIFCGNLLMLVVCIFYIAWWTVSFRPGRNYEPAFAHVLIALTVLSAVASVAVLACGLGTASQAAKGSHIPYIFIAAASAYAVLFAVTRILLKRPLTTELFIIILWTAGELSVVDALHRSGRFGVKSSVSLIILTLIAACIGIICYILYYSLDEPVRFRSGLIPLAADAGVIAVFLAVHAIL